MLLSYIYIFCWYILQLFLPPVCTTEDVETLLQSKYGGSSDVVLFGRFLTTPRFMESCTELFAPLIKERALKVLFITYFHQLWLAR